MATRISFTNPDSGSPGDVILRVAGNAIAIEDAPGDTVDNRNLIFFGKEQENPTQGLSLLHRAKYVMPNDFDEVRIEFVGGTSATVWIIVYYSSEEDIQLPF